MSGGDAIFSGQYLPENGMGAGTKSRELWRFLHRRPTFRLSETVFRNRRAESGQIHGLVEDGSFRMSPRLPAPLAGAVAAPSIETRSSGGGRCLFILS